jgi:hypothetical protein
MNGYLTYLKTMLVAALKQAFDNAYPEEDFRGVHVSIEYPIEEAHYPGIWVDYDDMDDLQIVGVDHKEYIPAEDNFYPATRWKFSGYVTCTVTALTSLERDRLYDELVTTIAFGQFDTARKRFRDFIEDNDLVAALLNFDKISPKGSVAAPGTPWGTDEIIYERSLSVGVVGEFIPHPNTGALVPLSSITFEMIMVTDPDDDGALPVTSGDLPTDWH